MNAPLSILQTGDFLLRQGLISRDQLDLCLRAQASLSYTGGRAQIGELILDYGFASRADIEEAISATGRVADGLGAFSLPTRLLARLQAYPIALHNNVLRVAAAGTLDETDKEDMLAAALSVGLKALEIEIIPTDRLEVLRAIHNLTSTDQTMVTSRLADLPQQIDDSAFISQLIKYLYIDALQERASDIHLLVSTEHDKCWIAHRIDGALRFTYMVAPEAMSVIATRIKSDAGMDFSDTMRPHDGRTEIQYNGKRVDIRVSTLPVNYGEKIVLRLLDASATPTIARLLELHPPVLHHVSQIAAADQKNGGVILVTGATGSGKSTTLNAILTAMDRSRRSIGTVEDPVELRVPFVGHTQVNEAAGLSYANVLRALMRQDPDVIMVGELRDADTVETALRAAETGHTVMSTLHTDNVSESITRLIGMMEPSFRNIGKYILAGSLKGVVNQKLVRQLCTKCARVGEPDADAITLLSQAIGIDNMPKEFYEATGCLRCNHTGYYGRVIVPEAIFIGADHETRAKFELILIKDQPFREVFSLSGVTWYPRRQAVAVMLAQGIMDAVTALSLLDMRHRVSAGDKGTINLLRETESEQT
jgi:type II secretory ATPase GspE/PulE/Tfp pilus assembly ATPase PilB-like protein